MANCLSVLEYRSRRDLLLRKFPSIWRPRGQAIRRMTYSYRAATSIVDYELTLTMPAALTAHVGIDTLTHAIEAYVSKKANELTDPIALSCIRLVDREES